MNTQRREQPVDESERGEETEYSVVVNHEEQYSIWPARRAAPEGWRETEVRGTKAECLAHIREVWTDMRPLSVRERVRESA
jgi:MbtH protein